MTPIMSMENVISCSNVIYKTIPPLSAARTAIQREKEIFCSPSDCLNLRENNRQSALLKMHSKIASSMVNYNLIGYNCQLILLFFIYSMLIRSNQLIITIFLKTKIIYLKYTAIIADFLILKVSYYQLYYLFYITRVL